MTATFSSLAEISNDKTLLGFIVMETGVHVDCEPDTEDAEFRYTHGRWKTIHYSSSEETIYYVVSSEKDVDEDGIGNWDYTAGVEVIGRLYMKDGQRFVKPMGDVNHFQGVA